MWLTFVTSLLALLIVAHVEGRSLLDRNHDGDGDRLDQVAPQWLRSKRQMGQMVGFYADFGYTPYHDVSISTNGPVVFPRVWTNAGNDYNNNTGIFTAPYSGLYTFSVHFMGGKNDGSTQLAIKKGDQVIAIAYAAGRGKDPNDQGSCTAVTKLVRGQKVSVEHHHGTTEVWGSRLTSFSGFLIQAD